MVTENNKIESPRQKFVRLCNSRVNKTLRKLDILAYLADKRRYEFSQKDVDKIEKALQKKLSYVIQKFREQSKGKPEKEEFHLEE